MKQVSCSKALLSVLSLVIYAPIAAQALHQIPSTVVQQAKAKSAPIKNFSTEQDLINDALGNIKEQAEKDGNPYLISCTYRIHNNKPISSATKVYYSDYRKKPDSCHKTYQSSDVTANKIVEVVYKTTSKGHVSLINKHPQKTNKRLNKKRVAIEPALLA